MSQPATVLIAGAGPSGLALALDLIQNGVTGVRIIDKLPSNQRVGRKGWTIWPRTIEILKFLGVLDDSDFTDPKFWRRSPALHLFQADGTVIEAGTFGSVLKPTPTCPWGELVQIGQNRLEATLRTQLQKYGYIVEQDVELTAYSQAEDHVIAHLKKTTADGLREEETVTVRWLVGCDGAHSIVRKTGGFTYLGETKRDQTLALGDIFVRDGLSREDNICRIWNKDSDTLFLVPSEVPGSNMFTFIMYGPGVDTEKVSTSLQEWVKRFHEITGRTDVEFEKFGWKGRWTPNIRMADDFQKGRVFLAGDAAHCHPPAGGQGLNSSVQDAFNLAWKLALVEKGISQPSLLSTYSAERLPVIASMLGKSTTMFNRMFTSGGTTNQAKNKWERGPELLQLAVNYRTSPIIVDDFATSEDSLDAYGIGIGVVEGDSLRAGDRAPQAPDLIGSTTSTTLFDQFKPTRHTILFFTSTQERVEQHGLAVRELLKTYPATLFRLLLILPKESQAPAREQSSNASVLLDSKGYAHAAYGVDKEERIVVVRPDGVIGAMVHDVEGLKRYTEKVLDDISSFVGN